MMMPGSNKKSPKRRKIRKYGDSNIIYGAYTSPFWDLLVSKPNQAIWSLFKWFIKFNTAMMAWSINAVTKTKHGPESCGFITYFVCLSALLAFQSIHIWLIFKPFVTFINPVLVFFIPSEDLYRLLFVDIHSNNLLIYTIIYAILGLFNVLMVYFRKGDEADTTKRGTSYLYILLNSHIRINEYVLSGLIGPIAIMGIGLGFWLFFGDIWMAAWMIWGGFCVAYQQTIDKTFELHQQSVFKIQSNIQ